MLKQKALTYTRDYPVLLVDDDEANLLVLEAALADEFTVLTAMSAQEALEVIERQRIAVVLTDQRMPGMTGVDFCEILLKNHPDIRRLLVTAYADLDSAMDAINRGGVEHYIQKPWSLPQLMQIIRESVAHVHLKDQVHLLRAELLQQQRFATVTEARSLVLHDLANLHQPIFSAVDALQEQFEQCSFFLPEVDRVLMEEEIAVLLHSTEHLQRLHASVVRRSMSTKQPPECVAASEILTVVTHLLRGHRSSNIEVRMSCTESVSLFVHRTDIARILVNLVRNAMQAIEQAGILSGVIELRVADSGEHTRITVEDNGPGIPEELRGSVFEAWASSRLQAGGSGLGLYIVRELAVANGGQIEFECPPSGGTAFHLTLPARAPEVVH